jgi:hypothetical protein
MHPMNLFVLQDGFYLGDEPDTSCLANFRLSLRDEAGATPKTATGTGARPSQVPMGGQWRFGVDERGNVELKLCAKFGRGEKRWRATALQNAGATPGTTEPRAASWSAPALWRFGRDIARRCPRWRFPVFGQRHFCRPAGDRKARAGRRRSAPSLPRWPGASTQRRFGGGQTGPRANFWGAQPPRRRFGAPSRRTRTHRKHTQQ